MFNELFDIPGFESHYAITKNGRVWSKHYQKFISQGMNAQGYPDVNIRYDYRMYKSPRVHRLMAITFLGLDINDTETQVDHKDDDKTNNNLDNLQLLTGKKNQQNRFGRSDTETHKVCRKCGESKLRILFYKRADNFDGLNPQCKDCIKESRK